MSRVVVEIMVSDTDEPTAVDAIQTADVMASVMDALEAQQLKQPNIHAVVIRIDATTRYVDVHNPSTCTWFRYNY